MRQSTLSKYRIAIPIQIFLVGALALLSGCYDASQNPRGKPGEGGGGPGKAAPKPLGLVILDVIRMSVDAMKKPGCSRVPLSLIELREVEAQARIKGMTAVLDGLADIVRINRIEISADDCVNLSAIQGRAVKSNPADTAGTSTAIRAKPSVHVRMVIWNGDRATGYPPWTVYSNSWESYNDLVRQRFGPPLSVTHFAATSLTSGYVAGWFGYVSRSEDTFTATTVENPSADDSGLNSLTEATTKSSEDFAVWLAQRIAMEQVTTRVGDK